MLIPSDSLLGDGGKYDPPVVKRWGMEVQKYPQVLFALSAHHLELCI